MHCILAHKQQHGYFLPARLRRRLDLELSVSGRARLHDLLAAVHDAVHKGDGALAACFARLAARVVEGGAG